MIKTNQTISVRQAAIGWMANNQPEFDAIVLGIGKTETITAERLNSIMAARADGIELPAIQYEPQFGTLIDGRHRLAAAYLAGDETIKADCHYC